MNFDVKAYLEQTEAYHKTLKIQKDDVWGKFNEQTYERESNGMIVARSDERCPIFKDKVPYKSVTVVCKPEEYNEVCYWLGYVHGGDNIRKQKTLPDGRIAIRSDYMCW